MTPMLEPVRIVHEEKLFSNETFWTTSVSEYRDQDEDARVGQPAHIMDLEAKKMGFVHGLRKEKCTQLATNVWGTFNEMIELYSDMVIHGSHF